MKAGQLLLGRSGQMARSHIRASRGRFHVVPCKEFISGEAEPFYQKRFIKAGGRFIKPIAVLSNRPKPNGHFIKTAQA